MNNDNMVPSQEQVISAGQIMTNAGFNSATALQIRLDLNDEVKEFQKYMLGIDTIIVEGENGEPVEKIIEIGEPMVNRLGAQSMMGWIKFITNKHTVQGNFLDDAWYGDYMCDLHKDVWDDLMVNREKYGIQIRQIRPLHSKFMMFSRLLLTRPIGDKERLGMNNTTRIQETNNSSQVQRGSFSGLGALFGGKR
jgi:hypothetical protein